MSTDLNTDIAIWPGSSSFCPGDTPFGFYDYDPEFQYQGEKFAVWAAQRLGYPIVNIELQSQNFFAAYEEAITEYNNQVNQFNAIDHMLSLQGQSTGSSITNQEVIPNLDRIITIASQYGGEAGVGGNYTWYTGSIAIEANKQNYNLVELFAEPNGIDGTNIEIKRIFHYPTPAIVRYFDPFAGTGMGAQQLMDSFGWGGFSPGVTFMLMPMYADLLRIQSLEFNDMIRRSNYSFDLVNNNLRIFPLPTRPKTLYFEYILKSDRSNTAVSGRTNVITDIRNVPYTNSSIEYINDIGRRWINKYALAAIKETLGMVRSKYDSIPFGNNEEITLDGDALRQEGQEEKLNLIEELRETLEQLRQDQLLEKRNTISDALMSELDKVPIGFYIGSLIPFILPLLTLII